MPFSSVPRFPQSWQRTLSASDVVSCPANQTRLIWQNFPSLNLLNSPDNSVGGKSLCESATTHNLSSPLTSPGRQVQLSWDLSGKLVGPNLSYITNTTACAPKIVAWVSQLNVTYSPLVNISSTTGSTIQPIVSTFRGAPAINGTVFVALIDADLFVTPFNITMLNAHVVARPALYQAG
jgi:hypothetical protein